MLRNQNSPKKDSMFWNQFQINILSSWKIKSDILFFFKEKTQTEVWRSVSVSSPMPMVLVRQVHCAQEVTLDRLWSFSVFLKEKSQLDRRLASKANAQPRRKLLRNALSFRNVPKKIWRSTFDSCDAAADNPPEARFKLHIRKNRRDTVMKLGFSCQNYCRKYTVVKGIGLFDILTFNGPTQQQNYDVKNVLVGGRRRVPQPKWLRRDDDVVAAVLLFHLLWLVIIFTQTNQLSFRKVRFQFRYTRTKSSASSMAAMICQVSRGKDIACIGIVFEMQL